MENEKIIELKKNINAMDMCLTTGKTFCPLKCDHCAWNVNEVRTATLFAEFANEYSQKKEEESDVQ